MVSVESAFPEVDTLIKQSKLVFNLEFFIRLEKNEKEKNVYHVGCL